VRNAQLCDRRQAKLGRLRERGPKVLGNPRLVLNDQDAARRGVSAAISGGRLISSPGRSQRARSISR